VSLYCIQQAHIEKCYSIRFVINGPAYSSITLLSTLFQLYRGGSNSLWFLTWYIQLKLQNSYGLSYFNQEYSLSFVSSFHYGATAFTPFVSGARVAQW